MGFGGGSQQSTSSSDMASWTNQFLRSASQGVSQSFIDPTQAGHLGNLWEDAAGYSNPAAATRASKNLVGEVMPGLRQAYGATTALTDPSKLIKAQTGSLKAGLGDLFREEINPAIEGGAIATGGFGGGRQGVAQGVATGQLADTFAQGYGDIVAGARETALNAGEAAGTLGQGIYNLGMMPSMAGLGQLQQYANLLGSPTVLSQMMNASRTRSGSKSRSASAMRSESSGWDFKAWL